MLVSCLAYSSSLNVEVIDFAQWTFHRLHGMISQKIELCSVYVMDKAWNVDTLCCAWMTVYGPLNIFIYECMTSFQIFGPYYIVIKPWKTNIYHENWYSCLKPAIINFNAAKITEPSRCTVVDCSINYSKKQPSFVITSDIA
jgi:hypothetical protein